MWIDIIVNERNCLNEVPTENHSESTDWLIARIYIVIYINDWQQSGLGDFALGQVIVPFAYLPVHSDNTIFSHNGLKYGVKTSPSVPQPSKSFKFKVCKELKIERANLLAR